MIKFIFIFLISLSIITCNGQNNNIVNYELVRNWPLLNEGYKLGQPTGVGIDKNEHIFVFHRAGRKWTIPFPDSVILVNTVLELDNQT